MHHTLSKIFGAVVGAILVGTAVVGLSAPMGTLEACRTLEVGESTPQSHVDALMRQGWYGDPTDGVERLYAPSCRSYSV